MRFLSMVRINEKSGLVPDDKLMHDISRLCEELKQAGVLLDTAGLLPTSEGVRVRLDRGRLSVVDGPFSEGKEVVGGYALLEAKSRQEAVELAKRFVKAHGDNWVVECEVRQLMEPGQSCDVAT